MEITRGVVRWSSGPLAAHRSPESHSQPRDPRPQVREFSPRTVLVRYSLVLSRRRSTKSKGLQPSLQSATHWIRHLLLAVFSLLVSVRSELALANHRERALARAHSPRGDALRSTEKKSLGCETSHLTYVGPASIVQPNHGYYAFIFHNLTHDSFHD